MVALRRVDKEDIRQKIDMRYFVARDAGEPERVSNGIYFFESPFRSERHGSFAVYQDHYYDFGISEYGDVFHYVMRRNNCNFTEAIEFLGQETGTLPPIEKQAPPVCKKKTRFLKMEEVLGYTSRTDLVKPYLASRGITDEELITRNMIGAEQYRNTYVDLYGMEYHFKCNRVAIPYIFGNQVLSMNFRRDDLSATQWLSNYEGRSGDAIYQLIKLDLEEREEIRAKSKNKPPREITDEHVREAMFGRRYDKPTGISDAVYGIDQIVWGRGSELHYPRIYAGVVSEGEFDGLAVQQLGMCGLAGKARREIDWQRTLQNLKIIYLAQDNDTDKWDMAAKKMRNPGREHAERLFAALGGDRDRIRIMRIPPPFKDLNDMAKAGQLLDFLTSKPYYLEPIR